MMMDMMQMWFYWTTTTDNFLFKGLDINGTAATVEVCVVLFVATFLLEGTKCLMLYWTTRLNQNPLTYGQTDASYHDTSPLFASLMIPSSLDQIRYRRIRYHIWSFLTHVFNLILGYLIMLAVMKYNLWILISVLAGSMVGYFIFGALGRTVQLKYANLFPMQENPHLGHINNATDVS